jgi:excinuclease ABC subunit B
MDHFEISTKFTPKGDQPRAIEELVNSVNSGRKHQVLLGVTGSGKTFTLANMIARVNRPTIVAAPNKTLAAQLFEEFRDFFPKNSVQYFVSYYDFYQPEAYIPSSDTYIEKDSQINEEIDRLRHAATHALLSRRDVIIVTSVSFIYGLGSPELYRSLHVEIVTGATVKRKDLLLGLVNMQYERNDIDFHRGSFRVRGDVVEIFPAYSEELAIRVEFFGDTIETITQVDPLRGLPMGKLERATIYPASHYVTEAETRKRAIDTILVELRHRLNELKYAKKDAEMKRLEQRTLYDIEMMEELGYCQGIENYSRHLTGRAPGEPPPTLLDYFPDDFITILDESHVTVPQIGGMFRGDRARKMNLVEHGFRLPSALDNRPLNFEEFESITEKRSSAIIYVSATPAEYEFRKSGGEIVEQIIRPTGLLDPVIHVRPATNQVEDAIREIRLRVEDKKPEDKTRVLVTVLTKKFAEDLTTFMLAKGIRVKYLHSDVETLERIEILRDLRLGNFDVLIGINLLREGLDLPEVSLVTIMDADKEGFLRSERSLIQTIGRAARNSEGTVILYADKMTKSMEKAISETNRRRGIQAAYNQEHGIVPKTILKNIGSGPRSDPNARGDQARPVSLDAAVDSLQLENEFRGYRSLKDVRSAIERWQAEMLVAAHEKRFEDAAKLRDRVKKLKQLELKLLDGQSE